MLSRKALKTPVPQDIIKQNNIQTQNAIQEWQTNDIWELKTI